jgi:hypothetical protein
MEKYIAAIKLAIESGYYYFGVRTGKDKKVGQYCALSHEYNENGDITSEILNGTCATGFSISQYDTDEEIAEAINAVVKINTESYKHDAYKDNLQYIIAGTDCDKGRDVNEHESIINNSTPFKRKGAKVIAII